MTNTSNQFQLSHEELTILRKLGHNPIAGILVQGGRITHELKRQEGVYFVSSIKFDIGDVIHLEGEAIDVRWKVEVLKLAVSESDLWIGNPRVRPPYGELTTYPDDLELAAFIGSRCSISILRVAEMVLDKMEIVDKGVLLSYNGQRLLLMCDESMPCNLLVSTLPNYIDEAISGNLLIACE